MQIASALLTGHPTDPLSLDGEAAPSLALSGGRFGHPRGALADPGDILGDPLAALDHQLFDACMVWRVEGDGLVEFRRAHRQYAAGLEALHEHPVGRVG
jgi:hypothetical protein